LCALCCCMLLLLLSGCEEWGSSNKRFPSTTAS
jgi:hypothetical protein